MIEWAQIFKMLWVPMIGIGGWFFKGLSVKYEELNNRTIRLENIALTKDDDVLSRLDKIEVTYLTRDDLEAILDKKFEKLQNNIERHLERIESNNG